MPASVGTAARSESPLTPAPSAFLHRDQLRLFEGRDATARYSFRIIRWAVRSFNPQALSHELYTLMTYGAVSQPTWRLSVRSRIQVANFDAIERYSPPQPRIPPNEL